MPTSSNYTIRTERWCRACNSRTPQISVGCRYSTPEKLKVPSVLIRNVTWVCQWCDQEEAKPDEIVVHVRLPDCDMSEMRAVKFKQQETGFITVDELMSLQRAGYKRPAAVPPKPQPRDVATLRKRERQQAFAGGPRPYD